jgi:hypothetical protein
MSATQISKSGGAVKDSAMLLTAAAKAIASLPPEPKTITGQVVAEVNRPIRPGQTGGRSPKREWPEEIFRSGKMIQADAEKTLAAILNGDPLVATDLLLKLQAIESDMRSSMNEAGKYSSASAHDRFQQQAQQMTEQVVNGSTVPTEITTRSRDGISADFRAKQAALVARMVKRSNEAAEIVKPVLVEAQKRVEKFLETREASERAECLSFGIPFHASAPFQAACHLLMRLGTDRLPKPGQWEFPSRMLAGIATVNTDAK